MEFTPDIVYEDNHLLVIIKPHNIGVQEDESKDDDLLNLLKRYIKERDIMDYIKLIISLIMAAFSILNSCLQTGNISLETYIKAYPDCAISNKAELLAHLEAQKGSEVMDLRKEKYYPLINNKY